MLRRRAMQRWTILVLAVALIAAVAHIALKGRSAAPVAAPASSATAPSAAPAASIEPPNDEGAAGAPAEQDDATRRAAVPLPEGAPKQVGFGVVLFSYSGAEYAPKTARSKAQALELAKQTLTLAQQDFAEATKRGDPGSTRDAGTIPRGVLEPHVEYALFTLEKNSVYREPLDTPRGFWLLRRNE